MLFLVILFNSYYIKTTFLVVMNLHASVLLTSILDFLIVEFMFVLYYASFAIKFFVILKFTSSNFRLLIILWMHFVMEFMPVELSSSAWQPVSRH